MPDGVIFRRFISHAMPCNSFFTPDFLKLHFEQVLLRISSENGAFLCFMHLVVHTYDYIHFVHLSMNLVITTLRHLQEEEINL